MIDILAQLGLFTAKAVIILAIVLIILATFFMLLAKSKEKLTGKLSIKNINKKFADNKEMMLEEMLDKKEYKAYLKQEKANKKKNGKKDKNIYVMQFDGDIKASHLPALTEEINAVLNIATPNDEVVVKLESGGGVVHGYGLGASQLLRFKQKKIPLTIAIDKLAASGGYMMACTADKILAAPFAIIGSIGVVIQMPNFNRLLKDKNVDFELHTAGQYKRTLTMFGENTDEGREKLQEEIESIHGQFKDLIKHNRPQVDMSEAATGEYWLAQKAIELKLVDELKTSDEYLHAQCDDANIYEVKFEMKKPFLARLTESASMFKENMLKQLI